MRSASGCLLPALNHACARRVETCTTVGSPTSAILPARRPALHARIWLEFDFNSGFKSIVILKVCLSKTTETTD